MRYLHTAKTWISVLLITLLTSACSPEPAKSHIVSPELVARQFMLALLKDKDEALLLALSSPALAEQIKQYSPSQFSRIVLNMVYGAEIRLQSHSLSVNDGPVRGEASFAKILVVISGQYKQQDKVDIRVITLQKLDGAWRVAEIKEPDFDIRGRYGVNS